MSFVNDFNRTLFDFVALFNYIMYGDSRMSNGFLCSQSIACVVGNVKNVLTKIGCFYYQHSFFFLSSIKVRNIKYFARVSKTSTSIQIRILS